MTTIDRNHIWNSYCQLIFGWLLKQIIYHLHVIQVTKAYRQPCLANRNQHKQQHNEGLTENICWGHRAPGLAQRKIGSYSW